MLGDAAVRQETAGNLVNEPPTPVACLSHRAWCAGSTSSMRPTAQHALLIHLARANDLSARATASAGNI